MTDRDEQIRARAHAIWQREGKPEGRHEEHWAQAAREIANEAEAAGTVRPPRLTPEDDPTRSAEASASTPL